MAIKNKKENFQSSASSGQSVHEQIDEIRALVEENLRYTKSLQQSRKSSELQPQQGLQKLLQENLKISKDLYIMIKKVNHWIVWQRVWTVFKILIIVVPIILGAIYLPPLLADLVGPYKDLLNFGSISNPNFVGIPAGIDQNTISQILDKLGNGEIDIQLPE